MRGDDVKEETEEVSLSGLFGELDLGGEEESEEEKKTVKAKRTTERHFERRIKSELALEKELPWHFEKGASYHCISFGDVDALTYLRVIVKQQRLRYVLLSTWCMAVTDAEEIKKWLDAGYIERVDFYVGVIFHGSYAEVYKYLKENCVRNGGRICVFRNHSKVIAGFGERFDFAIASSANVNTNPRCENTTITVNTEVAKFYKDFFDGVNSFTKDFKGWKPYELG